MTSESEAAQQLVLPEPEVNEVFAALALSDPTAMLLALGEVGERRVRQAIRYYEHGMNSKRAGARFLRMAALLLGAAAGLCPLVVSLLVTFRWPTEGALIRDLLPLSTILAALAVSCVGIDKLFGYSSGWMRFISASLELHAKRNAFSASWVKLCLQAGVSPRAEYVAASVDALSDFLASIDEVVRNETQSWVAEFRGALAELDKSVETTRGQLGLGAVPERGALEVRVPNVKSLDGTVWTLRVGGSQPTTQSATTAAVSHLAPGLLRVVASGRRGGSEISAERAVPIEAGKIATLEMDL